MLTNTKKMMLFMALFGTGYTIQARNEAPYETAKIAANAASPQAAEQDAIATKMIQAMQGCVNFYKQAQQPLDANGISEQRSMWDKAVGQYHSYIRDLRPQNDNPLVNMSASDKSTDDLIMQMNESKSLFARLLDEYIAHLGQVYEKQGVFKNTYYIASNTNPSLSIMPNEYALFLQTLQNATQQSDWGKTLNLTLPVIGLSNRLISEKNFTLNEIITAVRNVPLPAGYSTTAILGGVAATAAIGAGVYYAYNNMDQLKDYVNDIPSYFNKPANNMTEESAAVEPAVEPAATQPAVEPAATQPAAPAKPSRAQRSANTTDRATYAAYSGPEDFTPKKLQNASKDDIVNEVRQNAADADAQATAQEQAENANVVNSPSAWARLKQNAYNADAQARAQEQADNANVVSSPSLWSRIKQNAYDADAQATAQEQAAD